MVLAQSIALQKGHVVVYVLLGRSRGAARPEDRAACSSSSSRTNLRLLETPRIARRAAKEAEGIARVSWCRTSS